MTEPLVNALKSRSLSLGFSTLGVVPARAGRRLEAYLDWLESNYHGQMGYMARPDRVARRRDPEVILPGAQSIICVAHDPSRAAAPISFWAKS
jgi:epoxyqueuosine reductase